MREHMIVTVNSAIAACCFDYNFELSNGGYSLRGRSLLDAWRDPQRLALWETLVSNDRAAMPVKCRNCPANYAYKLAEKPEPKVVEAVMSGNETGYGYRFGAL